MAPAKKPLAISNPLFKWAVIINASLCLSTFAAMVLLAMFAPNPMNKAQESLSTVSEKVFIMTAGAFIGLLGGRAGSPDRIQVS